MIVMPADLVHAANFAAAQVDPDDGADTFGPPTLRQVDDPDQLFSLCNTLLTEGGVTQIADIENNFPGAIIEVLMVDSEPTGVTVEDVLEKHGLELIPETQQ